MSNKNRVPKKQYRIILELKNIRKKENNFFFLQFYKVSKIFNKRLTQEFPGCQYSIIVARIPKVKYDEKQKGWEEQNIIWFFWLSNVDNSTNPQKQSCSPSFPRPWPVTCRERMTKCYLPIWDFQYHILNSKCACHAPCRMNSLKTMKKLS